MGSLKYSESISKSFLFRKRVGNLKKFIPTNINDKRKRERVEFAIMHNIYSSKEPWADLVDDGTALKGRVNCEIPIKVRNICPHKLYGLPEALEV
ncbi:MAG: hypothetical protein ACOC1K_02485 [Nanoarchaeota archaeon]